ncbi:protein S40-1-like [Lycium ferocissimum]|uniref:protein S40-1-like n=1 Tax=Lycium ferocissimum TaxID=112874 RepID=UPI00281617F5|nr:protein S40-1-like [Lycium ferocissimum]
MDEFNGGYSNRNKGKTEKDGDFEEEDVWTFVKERDNSSKVIIPRGNSISSGSSRSTSNKSMVQKSSSSSPVNIPDWSKNFNNKKSRRVSTITDHGSSSSVATSDGNVDTSINVDEEEDDYGDGMVPPHEYIARRLARNQIAASFSMMEGVGRTLKGRDLSKLRNAILTKTGFLE